MKKLIVLIFLFLTTISAGNETCSRIAIINYQEILVDLNSNQKGEGLKFHLEKDPKARELLELYQKNTGFKWSNAALGTISTGLILSSVLFANSGDTKRTLLITGASVALVNFFMAKTFEINNEANLQKSIDEYNKRNLPRIYFNPLSKNTSGQSEYSFYISKVWSF